MSDQARPGEEVLYVPGLDHWDEVDAQGNPVLDFEYAADGPPLPTVQQAAGLTRARAGDPVRQRVSWVVRERGRVTLVASAARVGEVAATVAVKG